MNADVQGKTSSVQDNLSVPTSGPETSIRSYHYSLTQKYAGLRSSII